ncbi:anaerobic ribonucleoside triphosphate reductase [Moorella sp. E308F]|uniref:ribonucleoside triphosphate reductase n=1 Tax=unclassified Neomoorella TaxID=2676739 RepID=UPI0010FFBD3E|nr:MULTISPECIES: ribonucleoside triphosphate reductase [unclassified Moorella (in: firmicutes)]GEA13806.1 anaerobic ribonucleoside triphosphate reductase [Moorella sp. E308F]GEA18829.1 anaerobic ribonucleoside triphosphate reductase [Moorella sp. E306M]
MIPKKIIKRDGRVVDFDEERIINAIYKAAQAVGGQDRRQASQLANQVTALLAEKFADRLPTVEDVQDLVEKVLIENGHARTAKAYILYRQQHAEWRDFRHLLVNVQEMVQGYLDGQDWRINENSNMNYSLQGLNNHIIAAVSSRYWLEKVYPPAIREAHERGDIHIHDLGLLAPYCCGWDLADLLESGFAGVGQKVESAPPRHFRTALGQIANFFYTLQGEAAGAQAFSNFDTYLAPFIRYDGLDYREVKQALQEFIFNLNVPTRVGFQTPFVNLTMDVVVPQILANEPVIIGGERRKECYGDFQQEMDWLNTAFCEVMMEGDARGRIFTFPIPTYNITPDFPWESPVVEKILAMTAKYGIPYFANFINSDLKPEDVRSMCCRLRLDNRELKKRGGGLFGANPLTGSIGVVTINLPRLGYLSKTKEEFFTGLKAKMDLAKESLLLKRNILEKFTEQGLYPYSRFYLRQVKERFGRYWENHFNTIGIVGMHEALLNFIGKGINTREGRGLALEILDFMRSVLATYQVETGQLFNLEATPAEGTSYRLARLDKRNYPDIFTSGTEEPYYTNSTHLPVGYTDDVFTALEHQDELQLKYTGGTVFHAYLGERVTDTATCRRFLQTVMDNFRLPYFTITPTFSICPEHGYLSGEQWTCPACGRETEVWSRIVGYYRPVKNWNKGKQEEFRERRGFRPVSCDDEQTRQAAV